jgi:methylenetetrahydrofolate dehydrogenase (NADP+)/methenyltetrahydrofolate cyclohydrolase
MDIDGKALAAIIKADLKEEIKKHKYSPVLKFFLMQDHKPSKVYVGMKEKACSEVGIISSIEVLDKNITEQALIEKIKTANANFEIDGILVQMPLPDHINSNNILLAIDPSKDVDGFHPLNIGKMIIGKEDTLLPCTPYGICKLLNMEGVTTSGANIVILGRSLIVGRPLSVMLSSKGRDGTVTVLHSRSKNIEGHLKNADIIIVALGIPRFLKKEMVKPGAVVIDVGINHENGKLVGDVDYENVKDVASKITPVPGGVGPMTIAMLLKNTLSCHKRHIK